MEIRGAGILSVGAKTMPTVKKLSVYNVEDETVELLLTIAYVHLILVGILDYLKEERAKSLQKSEICGWKSVY
jgi:hypothetical protein